MEPYLFNLDLMRMLNDRPGLRAALQTAARETCDPQYGVMLAEILEEDGSYGKAMEWRRWVAQFRPDDPDSLLCLALTAVRSSHWDVAESCYAHLLEKHPTQLERICADLQTEGLAPEDQERLHQIGLRLLQEVLGPNDRNAILLAAVARLAGFTGDLLTCCRCYERALSSQPRHPDAAQWKQHLLRAHRQRAIT